MPERMEDHSLAAIADAIIETKRLNRVPEVRRYLTVRLTPLRTGENLSRLRLTLEAFEQHFPNLSRNIGMAADLILIGLDKKQTVFKVDIGPGQAEAFAGPETAKQ